MGATRYGWVLLIALLGAGGAPAQVDRARSWWQWGGPTRDFVAPAPKLALAWSNEDEPREIFRRVLQGGHSAIGVDAGRVVVVHGQRGEEWVTALTLAGELIWERSHQVGYTASIAAHDGPHAAPLLLDETVITVAIDASVSCWRLDDGKLLWRRDLRRDHGLTLPQAGYAASPLLVGKAILLPGLGGRGAGYDRVDAPGLGVLALAVGSGRTLWQRQAFPSSHASPVQIPSPDGPVAVFHGMEELVALRADSGELIWRLRLRTGAADNVSFTPVWDARNRSWIVSHAYDRWGAQAIRVDRKLRNPERVWSNPRLKVEHGNGVLWNGLLIASDGGEPGFLVALDTSTGALLWKVRMPKATLLAIERQAVLALDADGTLHLALPNREGPGFVAERGVLGSRSWTSPTLVGRLLLLRDPTTLLALRLP